MRKILKIIRYYLLIMLHLKKKHIKDDMLVTVEHSDIVKPCGEQFEALSSVHDSSKGGIEKGI